MTTRTTRYALLAAALAAALFALAGCSSGGTGATASPSPPASSGTGATAGSKLAPGLYDLADGTVQAVGVVEYRDLEGGFWAVIGGTAAEGDVGKVVAVITNGTDYAQRFKDHEGLSMIIAGTRLDGASTRMAGPEIEATSVVAAGDASAPAE